MEALELDWRVAGARLVRAGASEARPPELLHHSSSPGEAGAVRPMRAGRTLEDGCDGRSSRQAVDAERRAAAAAAGEMSMDAGKIAQAGVVHGVTGAAAGGPVLKPQGQGAAEHIEVRRGPEHRATAGVR